MFLSQFFTVAILHLTAVVAPGPTFTMVARNSLVYSRKAGIHTALGLAMGAALHILLVLLGIAIIITKVPLIFMIIKYIGASYLLYLGCRSFLMSKSKVTPGSAEVENSGKAMGTPAAIRMGFFTNFFNPYVGLFMLTVFTQVIEPGTPQLIRILYGAEMVTVSFAYFSILSILLSHRNVKDKIIKYKPHIEYATGAILIAFGLKLFLAGR